MRTILSARLAHLRVIGSLWGGGCRAERVIKGTTLYATPLCRTCSTPGSRRRAHATPGAAAARRRWDLDELPVLVDVLNASQQALQRGGGLEPLQVRLAYVSFHASAVPGAPGAPAMCPHARVCHRAHVHPVLRSAAQDCLPAISRLIDSCYEDYLLRGLTTTASLLAARALLRETLEVARADGSHGGGAGLRGSAGVDLASEERRDRRVAIRDGLREPAEVGGAGGGTRALGAAGGEW